MNFIQTKLPIDLEQCAACRILLHKGDAVMVSGDDVKTYVCDELCKSDLVVKARSRNDARIDYRALKFN